MSRKPKIYVEKCFCRFEGKRVKPNRRRNTKVIHLDLSRLYPTQASRCALDSAIALKAGSARLLHICLEKTANSIGGRRAVRPVFFYHVDAEAVLTESRSVPIVGLVVLKIGGGRPPLTGVPPAVLDAFENDLYFGEEGKKVCFFVPSTLIFGAPVAQDYLYICKQIKVCVYPLKKNKIPV